MPLTRRVRLLSEDHPEADDSSDLQDVMAAYASANDVPGMFHLMMTKLLEAQPLDPFAFLIDILQSDEVEEMKNQTQTRRFDLRRESTKKRLAREFYQRLMYLQRSQHEVKEEAAGSELVTSFLLRQLQTRETREHLKAKFPTHYRNIIQHFVRSQKELGHTISLESFVQRLMELLSTKADAYEKTTEIKE